ncbi:MAG: TIGR03086 family metal-binding protein [Acidimicrobiales bacterium]
MIDLTPATARLAALVRNVDDDQLDRPTPCPDYRVGDLIDHIGGLAIAFTGAAHKARHDGPPTGPPGDAGRLGPDWRARIPGQLDTLAVAWRSPDAWEGMTEAGGLDLPGEVAGLVALDEVVVHGWDLAVATGQPFTCESELVEAAMRFVEPFAEPGREASRNGLFGPVVPVEPDAEPLDRLLGLTGRDPSWKSGQVVT